jgi:hypothetical protein
MRFGILLLLLGLTVSSEPAWADNPFGLMLWPTSPDDLTLVSARAKGVGVGWLRPPAVFIDRWQIGIPCAICQQPSRAGLDVALTVRNGGRDYAPRQPSYAPLDLERYKQVLSSILESWKPRILVVENEEDNPQFYRGGPTSEENIVAYGRELKTACAVAHAQKIACANGGLSGESAIGLTWLSLLERGTSEDACKFAKHAYYREGDKDAGESLCRYQTPAQIPEDVKTALLRDGDRLLALYKSAPIDMVNLHWYGHDAGVFANVVDVLARASGKPVMSNEIGLWRWDTEPIYVRPLLRAAFAAGVNPAIWFSLETPSTQSLFNEDGSLRQTGREFAHQMSGRK